ncbi:CU044_2847 family protein [Streptomyces sp. NPDC001544]|uniref:CU044_2847 family protein n=1 Tax=Streptomyces sp. NPDC001544 TaxID=3364584 RepID=UPI0036B52B2F
MGREATRVARIELPDGTPVWARISGADELAVPPGELSYTDTGFAERVEASVESLHSLVTGVARSLAGPLRAVRPDEVSVEFGIELTAKAGKVVGLLADGEAKAGITVTLTWNGGGPPDPTVPVLDTPPTPDPAPLPPPPPDSPPPSPPGPGSAPAPGSASGGGAAAVSRPSPASGPAATSGPGPAAAPRSSPAARPGLGPVPSSGPTPAPVLRDVRNPAPPPSAPDTPTSSRSATAVTAASTPAPPGLRDTPRAGASPGVRGHGGARWVGGGGRI